MLSLSNAPRSAPPTMQVDWKKANNFDAANLASQTLGTPWTSDEISDKAGLMDLAKKLNPIVGYWDPLNIMDDKDAGKELIAWYRHAEIKHGRVGNSRHLLICIFRSL